LKYKVFILEVYSFKYANLKFNLDKVFNIEILISHYFFLGKRRRAAPHYIKKKRRGKEPFNRLYNPQFQNTHFTHTKPTTHTLTQT